MRARRIVLVAAPWLVALVLFATSARISRSLHTDANTPQLSVVALGGFRGLIADILWLRAERLQEEGRFLELVQLSNWIAELEPHNEEVWTFHAWNLAYNVSVLHPRNEDRWRWVLGGIELLRDRGIPMNPHSSALKRELGWIFQHKLGLALDSAAPYYRAQWAQEMDALCAANGAAPEEDSIEADEIRETLGFDAAVMRALEKRFGPIDWRVPAAASLYWGVQALADARTEREALPCTRMVYTSLAEMAHGRGRIANTETWDTAPNPALEAATLTVFDTAMQRFEFDGIRHAYVGFLVVALVQHAADPAAATTNALYARFAQFFLSRGLALTDIPPRTAFAHPTPELEEQITRLLFQAGY